MKTVVSFAMSAVVLMSMSQTVMAQTASEKVVRSDRIAFTKSKVAKPIETKSVKRTDRVKFNLPTMEQPTLKSERIQRTDRIKFSQI